jgi:hypothetical protein
VEIEVSNFWGRLSGAYVLLLLVHVALCCSHGFGEVFLEEVGGQTRPRCKMPIVDG